MNTNDNFIMSKFEGQWEIDNLEKEIANSPDYDIFPFFQKYLSKNKKILESGCGMGRWVFYYNRLGYDITGLDWSQKTIDMIALYDKNIKVVQGDARNTYFKDDEFDIILSLGTVEHSIEGPQKALNDAFRILNKNGIIIITVPIFNNSRKIKYFFTDYLMKVKALYRGKYHEIKTFEENNIKDLYMNINFENNKYNFFEYRFPIKIFKSYIESAGFQILEIYPAFHEDGIYQYFGSIVGKWNFNLGIYEKNILGRILYKLFPKKFPHMICCVAKKV